MKTALRKHLKNLRTQNAHCYASQQNLVQGSLAKILAQHEGVVAAYKALDLEIEILDSLPKDRCVCLPVIESRDRPLLFKRYHHGDILKPCKYFKKLMEPLEDL